MKNGNWFFKLLLVCPALLIAEVTLANAGKTSAVINLRSPEITVSISDSLPANKTVPETKTDNTLSAVVKEVPKAKKQPIPISVPQSVKIIKPLQIVKPKIIKPRIKIN